VKLNVERKPASLVELNITAEEEEFAAALDKAISKQARNLQIPGFRKGKAPRSMVERYYGRETFLRDAADEVMDRLYREALEKEDLRPVGDPEVEIVELEPVNFIVTVPVYPTVDLGDYASVRVDPVDAAVGDDDVQEILDRLQRTQSPWVDVTDARKPQEGDQVSVDYTVNEGDTQFQEPVEDAVFVLGETNLLQPLRDKIEDMYVGDTEEFELVFEEDDETADPQIRGKTLTYNVTLKSLKTRDLQPIDDEFAKSVAGAESVADLRQQILDDVHQGKTNEGRTEVMNKVIDAIAEQASIELPDAMIHDEVHHQLNHLKEDLQRQNTPWEAYLRTAGKTEHEVHDELWPEATRRLRNPIILQEIAKLEKVEVTDGDIDAEITRAAGPDINPEGDDEEARARAQRLRELYASDYFRNILRNDLFERKLTDRVIDLATEGKGAVLNAWTAPEPVTETTADATATEPGMDSETDVVEASGSNAKSSGKLPSEGEGTDWVAGDGTDDVPDGFPLKGNASSRIYHPEASPSYGNTIAEIYFATPEAAEAAGYRLPKSLQQAGEDAAGTAASMAEKAAEQAKNAE
jgi:trigger factor